MNTRTGLLFALCAAAVSTTLAGTDAAAQRGGRSSFQTTCASGARPSNQANQAQGVLNRAMLPMIPAAQKPGMYQQAYDQAMQGVTADANNPYNYYVAAQAAVGLNQVARADSLFRKTVELCPEFAAEVAPARQGLVGAAMEAARVAIAERHDTTAAISNWGLAAALDSTNTDAPFYVAYFSFLRGDKQRALPIFQRIVAAPAPAAADTDAVQRRKAALGALIDESALRLNANQNQQTLDLLAPVLRAEPNNHNAIYYQSLALYKMQNWDALAPVATRVLEIDPLNYNAHLIAFAAHKGIADRAKAQGNTAADNAARTRATHVLEAADALPIQFEVTQVSSDGSVSGTAVGGTAATGSPVALEFTLYDGSKVLKVDTIRISAPAKGDTVRVGGGGPLVGLSAGDARQRCGEPTSVNRTTTGGGTEEQWVYGSGRYVYVSNGRVTAFQDQGQPLCGLASADPVLAWRYRVVR